MYTPQYKLLLLQVIIKDMLLPVVMCLSEQVYF